MEGEVKCFKHVLVPRLFSYTQTTTIATILLEKSQNRTEHLAPCWCWGNRACELYFSKVPTIKLRTRKRRNQTWEKTLAKFQPDHRKKLLKYSYGGGNGKEESLLKNKFK